jgi:glycosyltransferase involved in cell wall biosynthesis
VADFYSSDRAPQSPLAMPMVSIITVVYNGADLLEGTLLSVLGQSYPNIEYIIVDGASADGTLGIIRRYEREIAQWASAPDKGIYDAMNKGLQMARGQYVWFMNCGDRIHAPDTLSRVMADWSPEVDALYGDTLLVDAARKPLGRRSQATPHRLPESLNWKSLRYGMVVCHQSFLIRRALAPRYIEDNLSADIDWAIRALKRCRVVRNTQLILSDYLIGGISVQRHRQSLLDRYSILKRHFGALPNIWNHFFILFRAASFRLGKIGHYKY